MTCTLKRIPESPAEAYLLAVMRFPVPDAEIESVKRFLGRFIAIAMEQWKLSREVFVQMENLQLAAGAERFSENSRHWMPKLGLGVWPSRPAPTLWTREDFQSLDVGENPRPLMYKLFRLSTAEGREQAPEIMLGRGTVMQVLLDGDPERFLKNGRELLLPMIQEPLLRGFPFHVPLLDRNTLAARKGDQWEKFLCGASVYVRESPEDTGVIIVSDRPLKSILKALGGAPAADENEWVFG